MWNNVSSIGYVGVPLAKGQPRAGTDLGPSNLRSRGIINVIEKLSQKTVKDYGDLVFEQFEEVEIICDMKNSKSVGHAGRKISEMCALSTKENGQSIFIGGDHAMAAATIHGHLQTHPNACVLWIDAHSDINLPQESPSKNIHGMPLCFLCHETRKYLTLPESFDWFKPCVSVNKLAYIGLRDIDECEAYFLQTLNIASFSMQEVERHGISKVLSMALDRINPNRDIPIHVSWDIDSIDPSFIPSTGTPVPHGLTMREALYIAEELHKTKLVTAIDIVEFNPSIGTPEEVDRTASNIIDVVRHVFGKKRAGVFVKNFSPSLV